MGRQLNQLNENNERIGFWKFYDDGILREEGSYVNGKKDGEWNYYSLTTDTKHITHYHEHETDVHTGTGIYDHE